MPAPFSFVALPKERSQKKPRKRGLTMIADFGLPYGQVVDLMQLAGPYVDLAKIAVGTSRLYPLAYLRKKLAAYRKSGIRPFIGGQFQEYVYATYGAKRLPDFYREAKRVGFEVTEISDNYVTLSDKARVEQIKLACSHGLSVFAEVGSKVTKADAKLLIHQTTLALKAGAELVLVEAAEFVEDGNFNRKLMKELSSELDMQRILIELPGPWISGATLPVIEDIKKLLIEQFGPSINIANVMPHDVIELEALRVGLGVVGPHQPSEVEA